MGKEYKKRLGDRSEGRRLRTLSPYLGMTSFIMPNRCDACNSFEERVEISRAEKFILEQRKNGYKGMGMLHIFIAAYIRAMSQRPGLNRFVSGQRVYARDDIEVVMTVKKELTLNAEETSIKVKFDPADTVFDVYEKYQAAVDEVKAENSSNGTDKAAAILMKMPSLLLKFVVWVIKILDYFGLLPKALIKISPFHGSLVITDLGSIGIGPIYHHIYNFGNLPMIVAMGKKYQVNELGDDGSIIKHRYIDYKLTCDERIADGQYYASAFKFFKDGILHPEKLTVPPEKIVEDID